MENNEYSVFTVKVLQHRVEYAAIPGGEMERTGKEGDEEVTRTIVAPSGRLGKMLIEVHFKNGQPHSGVLGFNIVAEEKVGMVISYDDRYRGQV